ncbi:MAG TPA: hypothetical protein VMU64_03195 [Acidimicrobiales bacterium]|nr:hypothetical protein [Acidimicrobiales bacterium]
MIRARYPDTHISVVQDNVSSHWTTEVRTVARQLGITLVATPTQASWMNRIECQFRLMVKAVFAGSGSAGPPSRPAGANGWPIGAFEPPLTDPVASAR